MAAVNIGPDILEDLSWTCFSLVGFFLRVLEDLDGGMSGWGFCWIHFCQSGRDNISSHCVYS